MNQEKQNIKIKNHIAEELGIDLKTGDQKFGWFLDQCVQIKLGFPWQICFDINGELHFYNQQEGEF